MGLRDGYNRVSGRLVDMYVEMIPMVSCNVAWVLLSLPIVTMIPATGGLIYAMNQLVNEKSVGARTVWEGFRRHFWQSWRWGGLNIIVYGGLALNVWFYQRAGWPIGRFIIPFWAGLGLLWTLMQIYTYPLLLEQENTSIWIAVRNSAVIVLRRPLKTLYQFALLLTIAVVTSYLIAPAWLLISVSLLLYVSNLATINAIRDLDEQNI